MSFEGDGRESARQMRDELVEVYGDALQSVVLYGSVVRGDASAEVSDVNLLVLLADLGARQLLLGAPLVRRWQDAGSALPMLFTPAEWARAADAFAIEVADMLETRDVLHGADPLEGMRVRPADLRVQAERELRGRVVQLREGMLLCADRPPDLGRLLLRSAPSVATYLRTVVRLHGASADGPMSDVAPRAAERAGVDAQPFLRVWKARSAPQRFQPSIEDAQTEAYFDFVVAVADHVDTMDPQPGGSS